VLGTENARFVTEIAVGKVEADGNGQKQSDIGASCCRWLKTAGFGSKTDAGCQR
jgi:hypothetical protein